MTSENKEPSREKRTIYVKPAIEELGDMADVTQKSGPISDQPDPDFFDPFNP